MSSEGEVSTSMDLMQSVQAVLKQARIQNGLEIGLRECVKALDSRRAILCILAQDCDEPSMPKLIEALCAEHGIPLIKVDERETLGLWAGICKLDRDGNPVKRTKASVVCVTTVGSQTQAWDSLKANLPAN